MASNKSKKDQYTFRQHYFSDLIHGRLGYIFISHNFQKVVEDSEILGAMSTDHSALFHSFLHFNKLNSGSGLWKFNKSLVSKGDFKQKFTKHVQIKSKLN